MSQNVWKCSVRLTRQLCIRTWRTETVMLWHSSCWECSLCFGHESMSGFKHNQTGTHNPCHKTCTSIAVCWCVQGHWTISWQPCSSPQTFSYTSSWKTEELDEMETMNIVQKVTEPTEWMNASVAVEKPKVRKTQGMPWSSLLNADPASGQLKLIHESYISLSDSLSESYLHKMSFKGGWIRPLMGFRASCLPVVQSATWLSCL